MKRLVIYFVVTFGLTWGIWIPAGIYTGAFANGARRWRVRPTVLVGGAFGNGAFGELMRRAFPKPELYQKGVSLLIQSPTRANARRCVLRRSRWDVRRGHRRRAAFPRRRLPARTQLQAASRRG